MKKAIIANLIKSKSCGACFFFILFTSCAFAGTTSLSTYYPPPTGAYNKIQLSSTYTTFPACDNQHVQNAGTVYADSLGNLHACIQNPTTGNYQYSIYPQECYNAFCSYNSSPTADPTGLLTCASYINGGIGLKGGCQQGFIQVATDPAFQTSTNSRVVSIACCSQ